LFSAQHSGRDARDEHGHINSIRCHVTHIAERDEANAAKVEMNSEAAVACRPRNANCRLRVTSMSAQPIACGALRRRDLNL
jgi:hypothetical protein